MTKSESDSESDTDKANGKKPKQLEKITSGSLSRGAAILSLGFSTGSKYAGYKIGGLFAKKSDRQDRFNRFLRDQAIKIAEEIGNLKGSIMKAGQLLSVYGEHFLPPEVNKILKSLQSDSKPLSWGEIEKALIRQLGQEKFIELDIIQTPIAAASMGQVYKAKIRSTGETIALKIQYPGIDKAIDSDLKSLRSILSISKLVPIGPSFDEVFKEIRMMLHHEADYQRELAMFDFYRKKLSHDHRFIVPKTFPRYSSKRVLAMSFEEGVSIDGLEVKSLSSRRKNMLGAAVMDLMFKEIFQWRVVQTDPHFGNFKIRITPESELDQIILFDFGAVRKFSKKYISSFSEIVKSSLERDPEANALAGIRIGFLKQEDKPEALALFTEICYTAIEPFDKAYASPSLDGSDTGENPYLWGQQQLVEKLSSLAKDAVFTFKLRSPPREAIFLDRKMVGMFTLLHQLDLKNGPETAAREVFVLQP